jgi:soluble lytic murein transglycosylase-like protein
MNSDFEPIILKNAKAFKLDSRLINAIIKTESNFIPWAIRYEPVWSYYYLVNDFADKNNITIITEKILQACSWGLMQVMGSVCREHGFKDILTKMVQPELSIFYGCQHLSKMNKLYNQNMTDVISAYNQGSAKKNISNEYLNQKYVDKVLSFYHLI